MSIDIEGYEFQALQGIDFNSVRAAIFLIENNGHQELGSDDILDFMISKGHGYYARIWNLDDNFIHGDLVNDSNQVH